MANATPKAPEFTKVKEVTLTAMTGCSKRSDVAKLKSTTQASKAWAQFVCWMDEKKPLDSYVTTGDVKDVAELLRTTYKDNFLVDRFVETGEELDASSKGTNVRTGKDDMVVLDGNGVPKFSSWAETRLSISFCGDLAHVVKDGKTALLLPEPKKVMVKSAILKLCKAKELPLATIKRSLEMVDTKKDELLDKADLESAITLAELTLKALVDARTAQASVTKVTDEQEPVAKAA